MSKETSNVRGNMQRDFLALLSCLSRHSLGMDRIQRCQQQKQRHEPWSSLPSRLSCSHQGPHSVATKSRAFPDSSNLVLALLLPIPQTVTCHVLLPTPLSFPSPEQTQGTLLPSRPAQYFHAKCDHHALYSLPRPPKPLCSSLWRHSATQVLRSFLPPLPEEFLISLTMGLGLREGCPNAGPWLTKALTLSVLKEEVSGSRSGVAPWRALFLDMGVLDEGLG